MFRKTLPVFIVLVTGSLLLTHRDQAPAQGKKDDLGKQVQTLKKTVADRDQAILKLEAQIQKLKLNDVRDDGKMAQLQQRIKQLESELKGKKTTPTGDKNTTEKLKTDLAAANKSIKDKDDLIATLQNASPKSTADLAKEIVSLRRRAKEFDAVIKAPFVHSLVLKTKTEASSEQVKAITDEVLKTLPQIEGVRGVWLGKPAEFGTPGLAQKGYQVGVVVLLENAETLDKFLADPLHKQFTDKLGDSWERPVVYDFVRESEMPKKADPKKKDTKKKAAE
ncbi:MAG: hypothetical protein EXS16_17610 [Gemmataceae bacterium]|nr:hypothetical protein [Gemmataceae bacterium]